MTKMYYNGQIVDVDESALKNRTYNDIAPVQTTQDIAPVNQKKKKKKKFNLDDWIELRNFKDGYDFGDITKSILGTGTKISQNFAKGAQSNLEGMIDAGANYLSMGTEKLGMKKATKDLRKFAQEDFIDKHDLVNKTLIRVNPIASILNEGIELKERLSDGLDVSDITSIGTRNSLFSNKSTLSKKMDKMAENSITGVKSDELTQTVGQIAGQAGLTSLGLPWQVTAFASSAGNEMNEAFQNNATATQAFVSGLISGVSEVGSEYLGFGGDKLLGMESLGGKAISKLGSKISNKAIQYLVKMGLGGASEGLEEVLSGFGSALGKKITYMNDKELNEIYSKEEALDEFVMGMLGTFVTNIPNTARSVVRGENAFTGLTENEQTVLENEVNRRIEERSQGKELTKKQQGKIREQAIRDLQKGYISADTIEETLGEKYNPEKDVILNESFNERERSKFKYYKDTSGIEDKYEKRAYETANEHLDAKNQSYELAKAYADLAKSTKTYIEFGSNQTQEFQDRLNAIKEQATKSLANKEGISLKEAKKRINNKYKNAVLNGIKVTRNGENAILLNVDSPNALNAILGHEFTHILEGTNEYQNLKQLAREYAESQNEYNKSLEDYGFYEGLEGYENAESIESEITADLVGKYVTTDEQFVKDLIYKEPTMANKFKTFIDDMVVKFTGTKEEQKLRELQKSFEKSLKEVKQENKSDSKQSSNSTKYMLKNNKKYGTYWNVETNKDIFKNIKNPKELQFEALKYIKDGNNNFEIYDSLNDNNTIRFINRVSGEYVYGNNSQNLNEEQLNNKMRIAPSIDDLIENASIKYKSPYKDHGSKKSYLFKTNGYDNFQGLVGIDNNLFKYTVKIGLTDDLKSTFYDVSLKYLDKTKGTDTMIPDTNGASSILNASVPSDENNISQKEQNSKFSLNEEVNNTSLSSTNELDNYIKEKGYTFQENGNLKVNNLTDKQIKDLVKLYHQTGYEDVSSEYLTERLKSGQMPIQREVADRFIEKELGYKPQYDTTKIFEDSEGNKLTKEQVEFFKDSDVRDIRGRLIPLYHRTNADFTVFDNSAGKQHGSKYGKGFYFSITPENYGNNTMKVYLNAKEGDFKYIPKMGYYIVQEPNQIKNVDNTTPTDNPDIRYSITSNESKAEVAKRELGTTDDIREAGFLTADGTYIDFSGKKNGGPSGKRTMDHRDIGQIYTDAQYTEAENKYSNMGTATAIMQDFIDEGNIRLMPEQGVDISIEPTVEQYDKLYDYIDYVKERNGEVYVDLETENKNRENLEYNEKTSTKKIIDDIKNHFNKNEIAPINENSIEKGKRLSKELTQAKSNLTRKENAYKSARGEERFTQYENFENPDAKREELREKSNKAHEELIEAQEKLENAQKALNDFREEQTKGLDEDVAFSISSKAPTQDSQGRELSKEQQDYFKDSKIRTPDGRLRIMYRGGAQDYTVFDRSRAKSSGQEGNGFYFTTSEGHAVTYAGADGEVKEYYLNITNPLGDVSIETNPSYGKKTLTKEQLTTLVDAMKNNEDYSIENYGRDATTESIVDSLFEKKNDYQMLKDLDYTAVGNMASFVEFVNDTIGTNYDGIVTDYETVALNSNQIKEVDNTNPTSNPDIRYSLTVQEANTGKDNDGREVSKGMQEYMKDSKATDENGNLIIVYHTTSGENVPFAHVQFNEFNPVGTPYYRFGDQVVNFFTDSEDMSGSYVDQNYAMANTTKLTTMSNVESVLDWYNSSDMIEYSLKEDNGKYELYDEREGEVLHTFESQDDLFRNVEKVIQENSNLSSEMGKDGIQYEGYVNITKPYIVDANGSEWNRIEVNDSQKIYKQIEEKWGAPERQLDKLEGDTLKELNRDLTKIGYQLRTDELGDLCLYTKDGTLAIDMTNVNDVWQEIRGEVGVGAIENYAFGTPPKISTNDIVFQVLAENEMGSDYDGVIIKNVLDYGGASQDSDVPHDLYITFDSNQFKAIDNVNPTSDADIRYSMNNDALAPTDGWNVRGQDIKYDALAPIQEQMDAINQALEEIKMSITAQDMENEINNGELDLNDLSNFKPEDINLEPFLEGLEKAEDRKNARKELKKQIEEKKSVYIPKDSSKGKGLRSFLRLFENEFAPIDQLSKDRNNPAIKHKADTFNNWVALAESNMNSSQTDINGKPIGRSGNSIIEEARKLGLENILDTYVKHWSNIDRARQSKGGADYSSKESYKIVKDIAKKHPEVKRLASEIWEYFRNARHNLNQAGIINDDLSKRLGRMYPHYVPYVSENVEQYFTENGELKPVKTIKSAKGGAVIGELLSLKEAMNRYTYSEFKGIKFNELAKEIIKSSNDEVRLEPDTRNSYVDADQLYVDKDGYYLTAYENGEPISTRINKEIYDTLSRNLNQQIKDLERQWSPVTKPLQWLSNLRRNLLTKYSPSFMLSNPIRDIGDAVVNSKYSTDFIKHYTNPNNIYELATNKGNAPQFKNLYGVANDMGQFNVDSGLFEANKDAKNFNFLKGVENINEILELAPRYAEFQASLDNGCSIEEAMYNAREVTTNFSRGGVITKALNRNGMTFLNASVQGLSKFIRNFSGENGAKGVVSSLTKAIIFGVAPSIFNDLAFGWGDDKDEDYEALPDYIKDNYYLIKMSNGEFFRIPKGRMISVFGSAGRRALEYLNGEEDAFEGFLKNADSQIGINNPEENNLFAPLIQAFGSKNGKAWYGDDIVPTRLQNVPEAEQYDEKIDDFSIWLGQKTGISPYKLNYVLDQYSGPIGDVFLPMTTKEATSDADSIGDYLIAPVKDKFIVDSTTDNKYVADFYSTNEKLNTQANSMYATNEDILKKDYMNHISKEMSQLYAERREVQSDTTLSKKEKFARAQAIKKEINRLAKVGMDGYENVDITGNYAVVNDDMGYYKNANGKWTSIDQDDIQAIEGMGLNDLEKSKYFDVKNELYSINKEYSDLYADASDEEKKVLSTQRKTDMINTIKTSGLPDNAKAYIYKDKYNDDLIQPLVDTGMDVDSYLTFKTQNFTADKNAKGQSISGSKKRKVFNYVNQMNIPFVQKAMLIKTEYPTYNNYNVDILEYINKSDLSYEEKMELIKKLGFKVNGNNVSW